MFIKTSIAIAVGLAGLAIPYFLRKRKEKKELERKMETIKIQAALIEDLKACNEQLETDLKQLDEHDENDLTQDVLPETHEELVLAVDDQVDDPASLDVDESASDEPFIPVDQDPEDDELYLQKNGWYFDVCWETTPEVCAAIEHYAATAHDEHYGGRHFLVVPKVEVWESILEEYKLPSDPQSPLFLAVQDMKFKGLKVTMGWIPITGRPFAILFDFYSARASVLKWIRSECGNMDSVEAICTEAAAYDYMVDTFFQSLDHHVRRREVQERTRPLPITVRQYVRGDLQNQTWIDFWIYGTVADEVQFTASLLDFLIIGLKLPESASVYIELAEVK